MKTTKTQLFTPLSAASSATLTAQLVEKIRLAIKTHKLSPGDKLPPLPELARMSNTSLRVPRDAIRLLSEEGLVAAKQGLGTIVLDRDPILSFRERVLLIHPNGHGAYYLGILIEEIDKIIANAGYSVSHIVLRKNEKSEYDYSLLEHFLKTDDIAACFIFAYDDTTIEPLTKAKIPYITCTSRPLKYSGAMGRIGYSHDDALPVFIEHCKTAKIKRILLITAVEWLINPVKILKASGLDVENIIVEFPVADIGKQESIEAQTFKALRKWLKSNPLPDLIFFNDDFAARGGILALAMENISYPKDVKLVAWSNKYFGPVAPVSLTRMMMDPFAHAELAAKAFLTFLRTKKIPQNTHLGPTYVKGESFP